VEVFCFGSGSEGNAFLVRTQRTSILIDAGLAATTLRRLLHSIGVGDHELTAIVVTHEHHDHVRGLAGLLRWQSCPVVTTAGTDAVLRLGSARRLTVRYQHWLEIGDLALYPVPVPHNAREPFGLRLATCHAETALFTDLGTVTDEVLAALSRANLIVLEANHDRDLLWRGPYPDWLKRRIASPAGHLSNDQAAYALAHLSGSPRTIWLAHLSQQNNDPRLALATVRARFGSPCPHQLDVLPQAGMVYRWNFASSQYRLTRDSDQG